ncbi:MAG: hypothetical protein PHV98_00565 [Candidatus Omnitrophica bacterium]|nr:hypothetical protein [Candidatus Omnitrophota bacterium]
MTDQALTRQDRAFMPMLSIEEAIARYNIIVEFTKRVMKKDKDFGIIPGTDKPTLLKPGAEKLCSLFGLAPEFDVVDEITNFDKGIFYYRYRCKMLRNNSVIATSEGSANSMEKKYRYRNVPEKKATQEEKTIALRTEIKSGKYGDYKVYVIENKEPFDLVNTLQKMAQKRALVAATLIAANASEFFTQDIEDMIIIDAEFSDAEHEQEKPKQSKSQSKAGVKPAHERPYPPTMVKEGLEKLLKEVTDFQPTANQVNFLRYGLELLFDGDPAMDDKRHTLLKYLTGEASTKTISGKWFKVIVEKWLKMEEKNDGSGEYSVDKFAIQEAQAIVDAALIEEGQSKLPV